MVTVWRLTGSDNLLLMKPGCLKVSVIILSDRNREGEL